MLVSLAWFYASGAYNAMWVLYMTALGATLVLFSSLGTAAPSALPLNDFVQYWAAGRLAAAGENPYDPERMTALEQAARLRDPSVLPVARTVLVKGDVAAQVVALAILGELGDRTDLPTLREMERHSETVQVRGRGFGFMPAIDLARAAHNAAERIESRR